MPITISPFTALPVDEPLMDSPVDGFSKTLILLRLSMQMRPVDRTPFTIRTVVSTPQNAGEFRFLW
ncbi:MAG: hypothetical protein JXQ27_03460 [Acidobacteria bacterium]|nr:hypothetical protein [Acidobacteriota bacterium]